MASPSLPQTETRDSEPGYLQVGHNGRGEIVMNLPRPGDRTIPEQHIIFSPRGHSIDSLFLVPPAGSACRACMAAFEEDYGQKGEING